MNGEEPTVRIRDEAERAEDLEDLRGLLRRYEDVRTNWQRTFSRLLSESGLSYARLAERSGLSRNTLRRWDTQGGAPRCRSAYLRLGFGFSMSSAETSVLLTRYGGYSGLYSRDLFDAACMFLLDRGGCRYEDAAALCARCLPGGEEEPPQRTEQAAFSLRALGTQEEFLRFAASHGATFREPHQALRAFLAERLRACGFDPATGRSLPVHSLFACEGIPARFEKDVSQLMAHGAVPRRERLIALGVRLSLTADELDGLLKLADMEPLCAKNRVECILIYALQQLELCHPELQMDSAARLLAAANSPEVRGQCRAVIARYVSAAARSAPEQIDSAADYLHGLLQSLAPEEAGELLELI